jgi:hypothetical protein
VRLEAPQGRGRSADARNEAPARNVGQRRSQEAGFNSHLVKPVDLEQLDRLLAEVPAATPAVG